MSEDNVAKFLGIVSQWRKDPLWKMIVLNDLLTKETSDTALSMVRSVADEELAGDNQRYVVAALRIAEERQAASPVSEPDTDASARPISQPTEDETELEPDWESPKF